MLAVLIDAIRSLTVERRATPRVRSQNSWVRDRAWLQSEDHSEPFSFVNICDALGIDPGYVRRCVLCSPSGSARPARVRRYAATVRDTWIRLQKENGGG
jgi:hypothetical protein